MDALGDAFGFAVAEAVFDHGVAVDGGERRETAGMLPGAYETIDMTAGTFGDLPDISILHRSQLAS